LAQFESGIQGKRKRDVREACETSRQPSRMTGNQLFVRPKRTAMICSRQACSSGNRAKNSRTENSGDEEGLRFVMQPVYVIFKGVLKG
jgi:hypothetical protein